MSDKSRVKRPTTATPRKNPPGRMIFQSTNIQTVLTPNGPKEFKFKGNTFRNK